MISYSQRFIDDDLLNRQESVLDKEILRQDLLITEVSSGDQWRYRDELKARKKGIGALRRKLHQIPVKKKTLWDRLRIRVYQWSIQGRIE